MTLLEIPVSNLSQKVLTREFGESPIAITRFHPLWMYLRPHASPAHAIAAGPIARILTSRVTITGADDLMKKLRSLPNDAGVLIHRQHLDTMMRYVHACSISNIPATEAIKSWFEMYGLTEDDYSLESAYRCWQRFRTNFDGIFLKKKRPKKADHVLPVGRPADSIKRQFSDAELEDLVRQVCARLRSLRPMTPDYLCRQVAIYLYAVAGGYPTRFLAKKFGRSIRRVNIAKRRIEGYLEYDPEFALCFRPIPGGMASQPL